MAKRSAATAMAGVAPAGKGARTGKLEAAIVDNIEALAIAVVMALVIRHFSVEAFKIPTASMHPTLHGDDPRTGVPGDRILVDKTCLKYGGEPRRWDVIVFRYPLNVSKNYIKRLVGLPGEHLQIRHHDIYIDGAIARKPRRVQDAVWIPFAGFQPPTGARAGAFPIAGGAVREGEGLRIAGDREVALRAELDEGYVGSLRHVSQYRDLRLSLALRIDTSGGTARVRLTHPSRRLEFVAEIPAEGSGGEAAIRMPPGLRIEWTDAALPGVRLEPGRLHRVSFSHCDAALALTIDGRLVSEVRYDPEVPSSPAPDRPDGAVAEILLPAGTAAYLEGPRLYKDISYVTSGHHDVRIPPGHYFMLGDNSENSKDSRGWDLYTLQLADGRVLKGEWEQEGPFSPRRFIDLLGNEWTITPAMVLSNDTEPWSFVPRRNLVGRAFFVFWPVFKEFRPKFIR